MDDAVKVKCQSFIYFFLKRSSSLSESLSLSFVPSVHGYFIITFSYIFFLFFKPFLKQKFFNTQRRLHGR